MYYAKVLMKMSLGIFLLAGLTLFFPHPAEAHTPGEDIPVAFLHIAASIMHLTSFAVMGIMCELYRCYDGSGVYGWTFIAPFALLLSHAHVPFQSGNGLIFAMGFAAAGYFIAILFAWCFSPVIKRFLGSQQADSQG
tara:strand:- start:8441 stop:8851 length:411 start_codon:yes stop_codon:yes gene_type:complete